MTTSDDKLDSVINKLDKLPRSIKIEKLPKILGMIAGGFVAGIGAVIWAVVEFMKHLNP